MTNRSKPKPKFGTQKLRQVRKRAIGIGAGVSLVGAGAVFAFADQQLQKTPSTPVDLGVEPKYMPDLFPITEFSDLQKGIDSITAQTPELLTVDYNHYVLEGAFQIDLGEYVEDPKTAFAGEIVSELIIRHDAVGLHERFVVVAEIDGAKLLSALGKRQYLSGTIGGQGKWGHRNLVMTGVETVAQVEELLSVAGWRASKLLAPWSGSTGFDAYFPEPGRSILIWEDSYLPGVCNADLFSDVNNRAEIDLQSLQDQLKRHEEDQTGQLATYTDDQLSEVSYPIDFVNGVFFSHSGLVIDTSEGQYEVVYTGIESASFAFMPDVVEERFFERAGSSFTAEFGSILLRVVDLGQSSIGTSLKRAKILVQIRTTEVTAQEVLLDLNHLLQDISQPVDQQSVSWCPPLAQVSVSSYAVDYCRFESVEGARTRSC